VSRAGALLLSTGIFVALIFGGWSHTQLIGLPAITACLFIATCLTIGGLERNWHSSRTNYSMASRLLCVNVVAGSIFMAAVGLFIGPDTPAGMGFMLLASVPVAAGIPAYAGALDVPAARLAMFALVSYAIALLITPILFALILGSTASWEPLLLTVIGGLLAPSILGVLLSGSIRRVPVRWRRTAVVTALLVAMVGLGHVLAPGDLSGLELGAPVWIVLTLALLRAPLGGLLGVALNRLTPRAPTNVEAALAGGYKNCALAGAVAIAAGAPAAAVPAAVGLVSEAALLALVSLVGHRIDSLSHPTSRTGKAV
jgi:hypothetical protein